MTHNSVEFHLQVIVPGVVAFIFAYFRRLSGTSRFDDDLAFSGALTCSERQVLLFLIIELSQSVSQPLSESVS